MNCARCTLVIEPNGKKMQMPCCDFVYHSQCGIDLLCSAGYWDNTVCACGSILHMGHTYNSNHNSEIEAGNVLLETDELKPHVKNLKKKLKEIGEAQKEFDRRLNEEFTVFEESVLPQLEAIKTLKENHISTMKGTAEYKRLNSAKISFSFMYTKFQKKYPTISTCSLRKKMGRGRMLWKMRYNSVAFLLKRKFRLRKWY
jgi:hypothetical protein